MAELKDIELARVGEFELSTGKQRFTSGMLADAARRATEAGAKFRAPLKLGHTDPRNDGEPAFGWLHNVRVESDGVLRGDATGVPQWLADNAPTAYPDRSIEANAIGKDGTEGLELTGLALLGQTPPGIATLTSWRELPGLIAAAADMPVTSFAVAYAAIRDTQTPAAEPVVTPPNPKEADTMSDTLIKGLRERLGVKDDAQLDEPGLLSALDQALKETAEPAVTPEAIAAAFKLTPEQVTTALAAAAKPAPPADSVVITKDVLDELKLAATAGAEARRVQLVEERDKVIGGHIAAAHIMPARRGFWETKWGLDPEGTQAELKQLGEPLLPLTASGNPGNGDALAASQASESDIAQLAAIAGVPVEALSE